MKEDIDRGEGDRWIFLPTMAGKKVRQCRTCCDSQCCGAGKLIRSQKWKAGSGSGSRSASLCRLQAKIYGIWAYLSIFSRFWSFILKLGSISGSRSASKRKIGSRIRIRMKVTSRIRIRIKVASRIRIRILVATCEAGCNLQFLYSQQCRQKLPHNARVEGT